MGFWLEGKDKDGKRETCLWICSVPWDPQL